MRRTRSTFIASALVAVTLALVSVNAFRQVPENLWDPEPGSVLFGVLHAVIGTAAAAGLVGLLRRRRWAAWAIGVSGVAAMTLLVAQPLYDPMPTDALRSLGIGVGVVGALSAGLFWYARRITASSRPDHDTSPDGQTPSASIGAPGPADRVPRSIRDDATAHTRD